MFVIGLSTEEPAFNRTATYKALVAAKARVSLYPFGLVIIHTICLRVIRNAWHFYHAYALVAVFKVTYGSFGIALLTP